MSCMANVSCILVNGDGSPMSFGDLLEVQCETVSSFANAVGVSRQCVYNYINGRVNPDRIPYNVVTDWCQYLRVTDIQLYNAMVESFESIHVFNDETGKWE